jgi:hypothetical protein
MQAPGKVDVCTTDYCRWQHEARQVQLSLSCAFSAPPWLIPFGSMPAQERDPEKPAGAGCFARVCIRLRTWQPGQ